MIINTDKLRYRRLTNEQYIAVYGTQENPYSSDYDLLTRDEAMNTATTLESIADKLKDEAERLRDMAGAIPVPPNE